LLTNAVETGSFESYAFFFATLGREKSPISSQGFGSLEASGFRARPPERGITDGDQAARHQRFLAELNAGLTNLRLSTEDG
jgi:hypothetical protein